MAAIDERVPGQPEVRRLSRQSAAVRSRRLIGRDHELAEIVASVPLTTVTGPGGVGKTVLALAVAAESSARFLDRVFVVWLASLRSADLPRGLRWLIQRCCSSSPISFAWAAACLRTTSRKRHRPDTAPIMPNHRKPPIARTRPHPHRSRSRAQRPWHGHYARERDPCSLRAWETHRGTGLRHDRPTDRSSQ